MAWQSEGRVRGETEERAGTKPRAPKKRVDF
jgi:hypothetical protein